MDKASPARRAALDALWRVEAQETNSDAALDAALRRQKISAPDRGLATELLYGTLRWRLWLDHYLNQVLDRRLDKIERRALLALRLGAYQLLRLRVPARAAVSESVALAPAPARGFVNAVLRNLDRKRDTLKGPEKIADPIERLSVSESHPRWLVERWGAELGEAEAAALLAANNVRPSLALRVNSLKTERDHLLTRFRQTGVEASAGALSPLSVLVPEPGPVRELPGYEDGWFAVQDEASQLVPLIVAPQPGESVLDVCAAPGTKTLALAALMGGKGTVVAVDANAERLDRMAAEVDRLGVGNVVAVTADATEPLRLPGKFAGALFDRVLVDPPCTGLGTIRRRPEIKWRRGPADIVALAEKQRAIIIHAAARVRPGGILVYSTCTLTREENEEVVAALPPEFERVDPDPSESARPLVADHVLRTWPHRSGADGFTVVKFVRRK